MLHVSAQMNIFRHECAQLETQLNANYDTFVTHFTLFQIAPSLT